MAKVNGRFRLYSLILALAVLFAGIVGTWAVYGENINDNAESVVSLEAEGCKPSGTNRFDIALIEKDVSAVQKSYEDLRTEQKQMRTEQRQGFKDILNRLPE